MPNDIEIPGNGGTGKWLDREIVVPMTVEYRNGVQSSTISYSNMVIPEGITNNYHLPNVTTRSSRSSGPSPWRQDMDSTTSKALPTIYPSGVSIEVRQAIVFIP